MAIVAGVAVLLAGGALAVLVAVAAIWPLLSGRGRSTRVMALALAAAIALVGPTLVLEGQQTARFRRLGLTEAGVPRNQPPPLTEREVAAVEAAVADGHPWALETPAGRCNQHELAYQWLAFRVHPAPPDCASPAVTIHLDTAPAADAEVVARAGRVVVTR